MKKALLWLAAILSALLSCAFALADTEENMQIVYAYLTETLGYNRAAACGVMSNIQYESNFRPNAVGDNGSAYGLCQWNSRRQSLINYCEQNGFESWQDIYGQLGYLGYELENNKKKVGAYLRALPDTPEGAYEAGYYFCVYFEIPASRFTKGVKRGSTAVTKYFVKYGGSYDTYTVDFRLTGGAGAFPSLRKIEGVPLNVPEDEPALRGYLFTGWAEETNAAEVQFLPGDALTENRDVTLFAQWKRAVYESLGYSVSEKGIEIISFSPGENQVSIPEEIDGKPVFAIRSGAFAGAEGLKTVIVPESVCEIDEGAFDTGVTLAVVAQSPAHEYALSHGMKTLILFSGGTFRFEGELLVLGEESFFATGAVNADFSRTGLMRIEAGAFSQCEALKLVRLPGSVNYIAPDALPRGVTIMAPEGSFAADFARENGYGYIPDP